MRFLFERLIFVLRNLKSTTRCYGAFLSLCYAPLFLNGAEEPKIYDCFLFYDEFDLLEIKLNELYPYVDKFVLVECVETFKGKPKPLYFAENKERFRPFLDKIIHIVGEWKLNADNPFIRQEWQRNHIVQGLKECKPSDIIIIEDADEIVRASVLPLIKQKLCEEHLPYVTCAQDLHFFFLNVFDRNVASRQGVVWPGSTACLFSQVHASAPELVRRQRLNAYRIPNAGWHFSYMGGASHITTKVQSCSAPLSDVLATFGALPEQKVTDPDNFIVEAVDDTYPTFVQTHLPELMQKGLLFPYSP